MRESIFNHFALGENVIDKRRRLSKILDIPYFGRIDFQEKKDKSQVSRRCPSAFRKDGSGEYYNE